MNTIKIDVINSNNNYHLYLFDLSGQTRNTANWDFSDNCILPYDPNVLCSETDKSNIHFNFEDQFKACTIEEEKTNEPSNPTEHPPFISLDESNCSSTHRCNYSIKDKEKKVYPKY